MAFKLIESAERRWREVNAPQLGALIHAGDTYKNGNSSNDPTVKPANQEVASKSHDMPNNRS